MDFIIRLINSKTERVNFVKKANFPYIANARMDAIKHLLSDKNRGNQKSDMIEITSVPPVDSGEGIIKFNESFTDFDLMEWQEYFMEMGR